MINEPYVTWFAEKNEKMPIDQVEIFIIPN